MTHRSRVVLVSNRAAGSMPAQDAVSPREHLERAGLAVIEPEDEDLPGRARSAAGIEADAVVAAGGDGTVALVAAGLAGTGRPMGLLPLGTMNMLARDLGLPLDPTQAAQVVAEGEERRIDLAEAKGRDGEAHLYTCAALMGLPSQLARYRERYRGRMGLGGWWRFAVALGRAMRRSPRLRVLVEVRGRRRRLRAQSIVVANNSLDGPPPMPLSRSRLDGGLLVLYVVPRLGLFASLRLMLRAIAGRPERSTEVLTIEATELVIRSARPFLRVLLDGEARLLRPPLHFRILPKALVVLVPREEPAA